MKNGRLVVLVTGANGFVGRNVAPVLASQGMIVRPATRKPSADANSVIIDGIGPQSNWEAALTGIDAVLHLGARVHAPREHRAAEIYRSINTDGTLHLARCAAKAGVREFIFLSTVLVNGSSTDGRPPFREEEPLKPRGVYGLSKAAAEIGLKGLAKETAMNITVIRPPLIYGPSALGNFRLLVKAAESGIPLPFGSIENQRAFLGVENLASFIVHRLTQPLSGFNIFLVADEEQVSTPEFVQRIGNALGRKLHIVPFPLVALKALLKMVGRSEAIDSLAASLRVDTSKAMNTGWQPQVSLDEGLRRTLQRNAVQR